MHFTTLAAMTLAAIPMLPVHANVNYRAYTSSNSCSGSSFGCSDGGAVCCGNWPAAYGYSAQFDNLAAGTQGQGYSDEGCSAYVFTVYGPGTQCWKAGGSGRVKTINWFHSQSKRSVRSRSASTDSATCSPDLFSYPDAAGAMRDIKVADAAEAERIAELYEQGNLTALADFEEYQG